MVWCKSTVKENFRVEVNQVPVQQSEDIDAVLVPRQRFDGGIRAWSTVAGAWLAQFCVIGLPMSFGATEAFYARGYLSDYTTSDINWIGSLQLCLMFMLGIAVGRFFDAGYFHAIAIVGSTIFLFGMFMLSLAKEGQYYQVFLSQGLAMAIGSGIIYIPSSSAVSHHFKERRALAMGFITTGSAIGGFVFSTMFNHFFENSIGFAWGIRIGAFICLVCLIVANFLMRTNYPSKPPHISKELSSNSSCSSSSSATNKSQSGSLSFITTLLRNPSYSLNLLAAFLIGLASFAPVFSIELFAASYPQNISVGLRTYLLGILNLSSIIGRIVPGLIVDQFNRRRKGYNAVFMVFGICMSAAGVIALCMPLCTRAATVVVFSVLYGVFQGSATALFIPSVISLDKDMSTAGVRIGVASVPLGLAFLVGTPISGAIVQHNGTENPDWWAGAIYTGVLLLTASALLFIIHAMQTKKVRGKRRELQLTSEDGSSVEMETTKQ
ncbi:hypothetical protein VKT23_011711 [Stygiomarasmius scandens]|uniref:Major facilitator superfamily (MFS) profile domain-containing protein n=1 Tax=Marasmiellus scandens TaxID=2682957 RepID=A0ABR1JAH2_9AGAR